MSTLKKLEPKISDKCKLSLLCSPLMLSLFLYFHRGVPYGKTWKSTCFVNEIPKNWHIFRIFSQKFWILKGGIQQRSNPADTNIVYRSVSLCQGLNKVLTSNRITNLTNLICCRYFGGLH